MKRQFVRSTSGWIPVSMLLLLIVALVAGQADADLPGQSQPVGDGRAELHVPDRGEYRSEDRLPFLVDAFLILTTSILSSGDSDSTIPDIGNPPAE